MPKKGRRDIEIDAVWDIEAQEWDKFVIGGIYHSDGDYREFRWQDVDDFVDHLLSIEGTIWAHFGGGYDLKWFLDAAKYRRDARGVIVSAGSRIVSVEIGNLRMYDSFALAPMSLEDFTKGLGISKKKLELPCRHPDVCGPGCKGYCSIRRDMPPAYWRIVSEYLRADCGSLYQALSALRDFAEEHDLDLGRTIGSSAWRNVQRTLGIQSAMPEHGGLNKWLYEMARKGYFGGRCQLYRRGVRVTPQGVEYNPIEIVHSQDVNSMYPYTLKTFAVPVGMFEQVGSDAADRFAEAGRPGIYRAIVEVPESYLPPLPVRYNNGISIAYPTGRFAGTWALPEINHAKEMGCRVKVIGGIAWESEHTLFTDWINKLWDLRASIKDVVLPDGTKIKGKKTPMGIWLKLYMNSLTGKFGSNPAKEQFLYKPKSLPLCTCKCFACHKLYRKCTCPPEVVIKQQPCGCGDFWAQRSDTTWSRDTWRIEDCSHVQFAAYLTSYARVELHLGQLSDGHGGESVIYSDTDSIYSTQPLTRRIGNELGEWAYDGVVRNFIGIAPKVYSYDSDEGIVAKAKGVVIPKGERPEVFRKYGKEGIFGFRGGLTRNQFFKKNDVERRLSPRLGDRILLDGDDFRTRAPRAEEIDIDDGIPGRF